MLGGVGHPARVGVGACGIWGTVWPGWQQAWGRLSLWVCSVATCSTGESSGQGGPVCTCCGTPLVLLELLQLGQWWVPVLQCPSCPLWTGMCYNSLVGWSEHFEELPPTLPKWRTNVNNGLHQYLQSPESSTDPRELPQFPDLLSESLSLSCYWLCRNCSISSVISQEEIFYMLVYI